MQQPIDYEFLGVDLATDESGDLLVESGDLGTVRAEDNAIGAFVRELATPFGYLGRYVYDVNGLQALDEDYGNVAYQQLSEPLTSEWVDRMLTHIYDVAENHPRINVTNVDFEVDSGLIRFVITFHVGSNPTPRNLVLERGNNGTLKVGLTEGI